MVGGGGGAALVVIDVVVVRRGALVVVDVVGRRGRSVVVDGSDVVVVRPGAAVDVGGDVGVVTTIAGGTRGSSAPAVTTNTVLNPAAADTAKIKARLDERIWRSILALQGGRPVRRR